MTAAKNQDRRSHLETRLGMAMGSFFGLGAFLAAKSSAVNAREMITVFTSSARKFEGPIVHLPGDPGFDRGPDLFGAAFVFSSDGRQADSNLITLSRPKTQDGAFLPIESSRPPGHHSGNPRAPVHIRDGSRPGAFFRVAQGPTPAWTIAYRISPRLNTKKIVRNMSPAKTIILLRHLITTAPLACHTTSYRKIQRNRPDANG